MNFNNSDFGYNIKKYLFESPILQLGFSEISEFMKQVKMYDIEKGTTNSPMVERKLLKEMNSLTAKEVENLGKHFSNIVLNESENDVEFISNDLLERISSLVKSKKIELNHDKLCKTIDLENAIKNSGATKDGEIGRDMVSEICKGIDIKYKDLPFKRRYRVCLENIIYAYDKLGCFKSYFTKKDVVKEVDAYYDIVVQKKDNFSTSKGSPKDSEEEPEESIVDDELERKTVKNTSVMVDKEDTDEEVVGDNDGVQVASEFTLDDLVMDLNENVKTHTRINHLGRIKTAKELLDCDSNQLESLIKRTLSDKDLLDKNLPEMLSVAKKVHLYGDEKQKEMMKDLPNKLLDVIKNGSVYISHDTLGDISNLLGKHGSLVDKQIERFSNHDNLLNLAKMYKCDIEKLLDSINPSDENIYTEMLNNIEPFQESEDIEVLEEASYINAVRHLAEKVKKKREISKGAYKAFFDSIDKKVEDFFAATKELSEVKDREKVIKGNVLPKASTIIKFSLAAVPISLINLPVGVCISVVGALGSIAMSKKSTEKQRVILLEELEMHLSIVERKIQKAQAADDEKAEIELVRLKNKLVREKARIKYNLKVTTDMAKD